MHQEIRRHDAPGFDPVLVEGGFDVEGDLSVQLEVRVPPLRRALDGLRPLVGDADAADERCVATDDQGFAMGTVIGLLE